MAVVSLELFKKHVYADDFSEDDEYLEHLLEASETVVINATNRSINELHESFGSGFPLPLKHAILMLAAPWFTQRESASAVQMHEVPGSLQALIKPYVKLVEDDSR